MRRILDWFRRRETVELVAPPEVPPDWYSWTHWYDNPPPLEMMVVAMREGWDAPYIFRPVDNYNSLMNVCDLYWKPWTGKTVENGDLHNSHDLIDSALNLS